MNGGNVEMGLINKSYRVTLNQRVPGSSPGAPTKNSQQLQVGYFGVGLILPSELHQKVPRRFQGLPACCVNKHRGADRQTWPHTLASHQRVRMLRALHFVLEPPARLVGRGTRGIGQATTPRRPRIGVSEI
jgi:hypothetical protein